VRLREGIAARHDAAAPLEWVYSRCQPRCLTVADANHDSGPAGPLAEGPHTNHDRAPAGPGSEALDANHDRGDLGRVQETRQAHKNRWMRDRYHRITYRLNCLGECNTIARPLVGSPYQMTT
jgi:hypothetical protein